MVEAGALPGCATLRPEGVRFGMPGAVCRSVGTGDDHGIGVRVAHPALPVIWPAIAVRRISMAGDHNLHAHLGRALQGRLKVVNLEPEQHSISVWLVIAVGYRPVMVLYFKAVQLKDELTIRDQLFICRASMITPAAEQTLIPPAARFHVGDGDQRLRTHPSSVSSPAA